MSTKQNIKKEAEHKKKLKFSKQIIETVVDSMYQAGILTDEEIKDPEKIKKTLFYYVNNNKINLVVDHREEIIETARQYNKEKKYEYATLFYAIFFEHTINNIIELVCAHESIDKKMANEIIKSININGKLTWLPKLLKLPKINSTHKERIVKNSENRNAFVHYKYNTNLDEAKETLTGENKKFSDLELLEKSVTYIKRYESLILYNRKKKNFRKNLKV